MISGPCSVLHSRLNGDRIQNTETRVKVTLLESVRLSQFCLCLPDSKPGVLRFITDRLSPTERGASVEAKPVTAEAGSVLAGMTLHGMTASSKLGSFNLGLLWESDSKATVKTSWAGTVDSSLLQDIVQLPELIVPEKTGTELYSVTIKVNTKARDDHFKVPGTSGSDVAVSLTVQFKLMVIAATPTDLVIDGSKAAAVKMREVVGKENSLIIRRLDKYANFCSVEIPDEPKPTVTCDDEQLSLRCILSPNCLEAKLNGFKFQGEPGPRTIKAQWAGLEAVTTINVLAGDPAQLVRCPRCFSLRA